MYRIAYPPASFRALFARRRARFGIAGRKRRRSDAARRSSAPVSAFPGCFDTKTNSETETDSDSETETVADTDTCADDSSAGKGNPRQYGTLANNSVFVAVFDE